MQDSAPCWWKSERKKDLVTNPFKKHNDIIVTKEDVNGDWVVTESEIWS